MHDLVLQHVCKSYGAQQVVAELSLTVPAGTVSCWCGPSGCGKTTLLRMIAGLTVPDSGTISVPGKIGVLFQEPRLLPTATLLQNVRLAQSTDGMDAAQALARVGLASSGSLRPAAASGGMRQRAAIARLLAFGGDLWLLDEPFKEQDPATRAQLYDLLQAQWRGKTVVLVTHDLAEAAYLGDQTIEFGANPCRVLQIRHK